MKIRFASKNYLFLIWLGKNESLNLATINVDNLAALAVAFYVYVKATLV